VQSFVTQLSYGTILVASLLMTLVLPFIQRHVKNFSALLYFVVLAVAALGVILHMTYDYAGLAPMAGMSIPTLFAPVDVGLSGYGNAYLMQYWLGAAFVAIAVPVLLRLIVTRSNRKDIGPAIYIVVLAITLLVVYAISHGMFSGILLKGGTP
jgi:ribose transport system permease protein